jgi:Mn2+/Fe2+ NRAMP family transporter
MAVIIVLSSKKSVMGEFTASRSLVVLGWIGTAVMAIAAACMLLAPG